MSFSCVASPIISIPEIIFDVKSASANWAAGSNANRVHATGSLFHLLAPAMRFAGRSHGDKQDNVWNAAFLSGSLN